MTEGVSSENEDSSRASEDSRSTAFRPSTDAFVNAVFNARVLWKNNRRHQYTPDFSRGGIIDILDYS